MSAPGVEPRGRGSSPDPLRLRAAAAKLMADLARNGVHLQLRAGVVTWTAGAEEPTIAEQWAIRQLSATLTTILAEEREA